MQMQMQGPTTLTPTKWACFGWFSPGLFIADRDNAALKEDALHGGAFFFFKVGFEAALTGLP